MVSQLMSARSQNVDRWFRMYTILVPCYFSSGSYGSITHLLNENLSSEGVSHQLDLNTH